VVITSSEDVMLLKQYVQAAWQLAGEKMEVKTAD